LPAALRSTGALIAVLALAAFAVLLPRASHHAQRAGVRPASASAHSRATVARSGLVRTCRVTARPLRSTSTPGPSGDSALAATSSTTGAQGVASSRATTVPSSTVSSP